MNKADSDNERIEKIYKKTKCLNFKYSIITALMIILCTIIGVFIPKYSFYTSVICTGVVLCMPFSASSSQVTKLLEINQNSLV